MLYSIGMHHAPAQKFPVAALFILIAIFTGACVVPGPSPDPARSYTGPVSLSALLSRPLSWDKLDGLTDWIDEYGSRASSRDRNDARLALADGREAFVRRDQSKVSGAVLARRRSRAKLDYQLVLDDRNSSSAQRTRAQHGLARLGGKYTGSPKPASSQSLKGTSLSVISRASWGAAREIPGRMSTHRAPWSRITVHHTAMPLGASTSLSSRSAEMRVIQRSHFNRVERFGDLGYHFLIDPEGRIYEGRRIAWKGAHVGSMNDHNLGVCLLGNFETSRPTGAALASLEHLLDDLRGRNGIARSAVTWHKNWPSANTACPGKHLEPYVRRYREGMALSTSLSYSK